jgi:hypothetical protein
LFLSRILNFNINTSLYGSLISKAKTTNFAQLISNASPCEYRLHIFIGHQPSAEYDRTHSVRSGR